MISFPRNRTCRWLKAIWFQENPQELQNAYVSKDKSGVDKIIVKKQPYQLLNTNREFFPCFDASNFHKFVYESS